MAKEDVINQWREKSSSTLEVARLTFEEGYLETAVNRIYYAMFYEVTALLLIRGLSFKTHIGVKSAFHDHFIKTGIFNKATGKFYDAIYETRSASDYDVFAEFEEREVERWLEQAEKFIEEVERVIQKEIKG